MRVFVSAEMPDNAVVDCGDVAYAEMILQCL
jgi:hypothetical protein